MSFNENEFEKITREVFAPIYPVIAKYIVKSTGVICGKCIDVGTGAGSLGIEVAKLTNNHVYLFDISEKMLEFASENTNNAKLSNRVEVICGDVHSIPFPNEYFDLITSRGSVFFWEDKVKAFQEIYRVLSPGGIAVIGGGFGNKELKERIDEIMEQKDSNWHNDKNKRLGENPEARYKAILDDAGIKDYKITNNESGFWIHIRRAD